MGRHRRAAVARITVLLVAMIAMAVTLAAVPVASRSGGLLVCFTAVLLVIMAWELPASARLVHHCWRHDAKHKHQPRATR